MTEPPSRRVRGLRPVIEEIEKSDRDLARQLRRASASVALNVSEGGGSHGGTRVERYRNALGSARETGACLDVALALGYVDGVDAKLLDRLDHVRAVLVKLGTEAARERIADATMSPRARALVHRPGHGLASFGCRR